VTGQTRAQVEARAAAGIEPESDGAKALAAVEKEAQERERVQRSALDSKFGAFGWVCMPSDAAAPILSQPIRLVLHQWLFEMNAREELKAVGIIPRTRAMLHGPPGCGKTTLAHHIAARLGIPLIVIQAHTVKSMWVGQSGMNLGKLFRAARADPSGVALFFDEFDSMAVSREGKGRSGAEDERNAITIAFMQELDRFQGLVFAATNEPDAIDRAIWRRFQMHVAIEAPGEVERDAIVRLYLAPFEPDERLVRFVSDMTAGASPALIRDICEALKRQLVLAPIMNLSLELPDILRSIGDSLKPSDGGDPPAFWLAMSQWIMDARSVPWPPTRAKEEA
jgi:hypothetical protein